jgi:AraC-like DNA-binding protein
MVIQIELSKILQIFYNATVKSRNRNSSTSVEYSRMIADYLKNALTNQILSYIKNGYLIDETNGLVEKAINQVGISDGYGFRVFKQTYGISPREYLSKLKVNESKKLLIKPQYSISDISTALGYTDLANFSRQFKRWTNQSPRNWRNQHESD